MHSQSLQNRLGLLAKCWVPLRKKLLTHLPRAVAPIAAGWVPLRKKLLTHPIPSEQLRAMFAAGRFANETASIKPIKTTQSGQVEEPLLARDIRFLFEPNSGKLDTLNAQNTADLEYLSKIMYVSPGSTLLLRGHVDNSMVEEFRKQGGASLVQTMSVKAVQLSKDRTNSVRDQLIQKYKIAADRIESLGCGWREPIDADDHAKNRRVEAQWFTVE